MTLRVNEINREIYGPIILNGKIGKTGYTNAEYALFTVPKINVPTSN